MKKFECSGPEQMKPFRFSDAVDREFLVIAREKDRDPQRRIDWDINLPRLKGLDAKFKRPEELDAKVRSRIPDRRCLVETTTSLMETLRQGM